MIKIKAGTHGEILLPKKIREELGISRGATVFAEVKGKSVEIRAGQRDVIKEMEACAKRHNCDVSAWKLGNDLYEELAKEGF